MKRLIIFVVLSLILITSVVIFLERASHKEITYLMGTKVKIVVKDFKPRGKISACLSYLRKLDYAFNRFNPRSEISLLNRMAGIAKVRVEKDTFDIIKRSIQISELTKGAFDITLSNYELIEIDPKEKTVKIAKRGVTIDLGGIAKGYATEKTCQLLKEKDVKKAMIDMGSTIGVLGDGWKIGIKDPFNPGNILKVITLKDGEILSTSGVYEQEGHIIDPRTSKVADSCYQVTVVSKDGALSDAMATAIIVLGPEEGLKLARFLNLKAIVVTNDKNVVELW